MFVELDQRRLRRFIYLSRGDWSKWLFSIIYSRYLHLVHLALKIMSLTHTENIIWPIWRHISIFKSTEYNYLFAMNDLSIIVSLSFTQASTFNDLKTPHNKHLATRLFSPLIWHASPLELSSSTHTLSPLYPLFWCYCCATLTLFREVKGSWEQTFSPKHNIFDTLSCLNFRFSI